MGCEAEVSPPPGDGHLIAVGGNQWGNDMCGNADEDGSDECAAPEFLNAAEGKTATQSSEGWGGAPGRAVDGSTNGGWGGGSCTHTQNGAVEWWQVDLGAATTVTSVDVYHRTDCCQDRLGGAVVTVSTTADYTSGGTECGTVDVAAMSSIDCGGAEGQFVTVSHANQYITICEAQVWTPNTGGDTPDCVCNARCAADDTSHAVRCCADVDGPACNP